MRGNSKKLLIFEILIILIVLLNNFVSSILSGYIEVLFIIALLILFRLFFGFEKDRHHLWRNVCIEILIFLLVFFIAYYALGLLISFTKITNYYNISAIKNILLPLVLIIVLREILRYMVISKSLKDKRIITLTCISFIFIDLIGKCNVATFNNKYTTFIFLATIFLPIISKNILCTYVSFKVGFKPVILYALITELFGYLIPIIPNPNQYIYSIIWLIMPFILLYRLYLYFANNEKDTKLERSYNKRKIIRLLAPTFIVVILVYFVSGYFHYHAIVIASGSMETSISKGDVVIVEKIDGNIDSLELEQVIAYNYNKKIVVHRLIKMINIDGETIYYTKGDANNDIDNYKITKDMIIGIVNFKIPYVGYPTIWLNEL